MKVDKTKADAVVEQAVEPSPTTKLFTQLSGELVALANSVGEMRWALIKQGVSATTADEIVMRTALHLVELNYPPYHF